MTKPVSDPIDLTDARWRDDPNLLRLELAGLVKTGIAIDAGIVRPIDTLTVQVLLSAKRATNKIGSAFEVRNASDTFRSGLHVLGLHNEILG